MARCGDCVKGVEAENVVLHTTNTHLQQQLDIMKRERAGQAEAEPEFKRAPGSRFSVAELRPGASGRRRRGCRGRSRGRSRGRRGRSRGRSRERSRGRSRGRKGRSRGHKGHKGRKGRSRRR